MIETTITCDNCQREKQSTNKWWAINATRTGKVAPAPSLYMMPWHRANEQEISEAAHACSRECAHKIIEQWMEKTEAA